MYASSKGKQDDPGVLLLCAIDLTAYKKSDYEKRKGGRIYHFIPQVPKNAVAEVLRIDQFTRTALKEKANLLRTRIREHRLKRYEIGRSEREIVITRNCSVEAIAYWINTYLNPYTDRRVETVHPGIKQIRIWVEKNYANGRISPISQREMLMQATRYIPMFAENTRAISAGT
jgi:hypothetical protein